jgi:hypothetical protein
MKIEFIGNCRQQLVPLSEKFIVWFNNHPMRSAYIARTVGGDMNFSKGHPFVLATRGGMVGIDFESSDKRKIAFLFTESPEKENLALYVSQSPTNIIKVGSLSNK